MIAARPGAVRSVEAGPAKELAATAWPGAGRRRMGSVLIAMFYGGYGYGGSWILFLFIAMLVIRMIASRRSGSGQPRRGPGPQGYGWGSGPAPGPTSASFTPTDAPSSAASPPADAPAPVGGYKIPPGWFPDPTGRFDQRYWSGTAWTEHVTKDGVPGNDAPPASLSGTA
jgi:hypothetical protein